MLVPEEMIACREAANHHNALPEFYGNSRGYFLHHGSGRQVIHDIALVVILSRNSRACGSRRAS